MASVAWNSPWGLGSNPRSPYFLYNIFLQEIQCTHELGVHHIPSPSNTPDGQMARSGGHHWRHTIDQVNAHAWDQKSQYGSASLGQNSCYSHPLFQAHFSSFGYFIYSIYLFVNYFINQKYFSFYKKITKKYFLSN